MDNSVIKDPVKKTAATPLNVKTWVEEDFAIVELSGALTLSPSLNQLSETVRKMLQAIKLAGLILCVSDVTYTDSAGLGELTRLYSLSSKRPCPLRMVGIPAHLKKVLEMTRLDELLQAADTIAIAKKQMKP